MGPPGNLNADTCAATPKSAAPERIMLTHPQDLALARIAQRARVASTTMPSGLVTPEEEYLIVGPELVRADLAGEAR